jgi:hypothetical protein
MHGVSAPVTTKDEVDEKPKEDVSVEVGKEEDA